MGNTSSESKEKKINRRYNITKHFATYIFVNSIVVAFDYLFTDEVNWSIYLIFGWGLGLFVHSFLFVFDETFESLKEKKIKKH